MIIVELTNIFKGLDLIKCLKIMGESSLLCTGGGDKDHPPQKKEMQKDKMVVWDDLTNNWEKKRSEMWKWKEKRRDTPIWMQSFKE